MCSDSINGFEGLKVMTDISCPLEGEATTSESRLHLNDILDMLIRLDQQRIFMEPVDDSFAPDYSKVIRKPMCFLKMKEKIFSEEYTSWASFVEDFECICSNAMKYNQKRSKIWNAAKLLLSQGKRCLQQQLVKHKTILGMRRKANGDEDSKLEDKVHETTQLSFMFEKQMESPLPKNFNSYAAKNDDLNCAAEEPQVPVSKEMGIQEQHAVSPRNWTMVKSCDDVTVDILELPSHEVVRMDLGDETTECSSSFSGMPDEVDDTDYEVESLLRDGNGAQVLTEEHDTPKRKRKALNPEWKAYRQGIEWRCHWLELQMNKLQAQASKYSRILHTANIQKEQWLEHQQGALAARTRTTLDGYGHEDHILKRQQRRRVEESADNTRLYMLKHPVFSRYEKKKKRSEESSPTQGDGDDTRSSLQFNDFEDRYEDKIPVEKDSLEDFLWQIEALQVHTSDLRAQLTHRGPSGHPHASKALFRDSEPPHLMSMLGSPRATPTHLQSPGGSTGRTLARGSKGHGGSSSRRRNIDFDINNVIMPDTVMANYVEPARHAFIETPHWRFVRESLLTEAECSSHEDTDDEAYAVRHAEMQRKERQQHNDPLVLHKTRGLSSAKERPRPPTAIGKGSPEGGKTVWQDERLLAPGFGDIPKRKRWKRDPKEATRGMWSSQHQTG